MGKRIVVVVVAILLAGCVTKIENTYTMNGNNNIIRAADTATATPTASDVVDAAGTGNGNASANGGQ